MDEELLKILACPACLAPLHEVGPDAKKKYDGGLKCAACAKIYPIEQGIPVLLKEKAVDQASWERAPQK